MANRWFSKLRIYYKGYMGNNTSIERYKPIGYWIVVHIFYDIKEENTTHLSTENITRNKIGVYLWQKIGNWD